MKRRDTLKATGATFIGASLGGCLQGNGGSNDTVKIGSIAPQSGPYATLGSHLNDGQSLAISEINADGGINGRNVEVITRDSQADPSTAIQEVNDLISAENIDLVTGGISSTVTRALMDPAKRAGIPHFNCSSRARSLTNADCQRNFFRFIHHVEHQAVPFAPWLYENVGESMYIMYNDYSWGESGRDLFSEHFEDAGGEIVGTHGVPLGTTDFSEHLTQVDRDADIFFAVVSGTDAASLINQSKEFGIHEDMTRAGVDVTSGNIDGTAGARDDMVVIQEYPDLRYGPWENDVNRTFWENYEDQYDATPIYVSAYGYTMLKIVAAAANEAGFEGSNDTDALISALEGFKVDEEMVPMGTGMMREANHQMLWQQEIADASGDFSSLEIVPYESLQSIEPDCQL